ncbi:MAG: flagellin [Acidobacteria bacterium]|nr:flagellin [Acidobacteriota bacterium]
MALSITNNIAALNAYQNLTNAQDKLTSSIAKLSSGNAITSAGDNAAGLAISTGLTSQVNGLNVAATNAQSGLDVVQTASGALTQVTSMLQRLRDLAVQAANDSNSTSSRADIGTEATQITSELTRISTATTFNGIHLLDGTGGTAGVLNFQVGANGTADNTIAVDLSTANVGAVVTGLGTLDFSTNTGATAAISTIDTQLGTVSTAQANLGATENRFTSAIASVNVASQNLNSASSQITSTDMAKQMVIFTGQQVQSQAATAILAQANQLPQGILKLLG